jgi:hypothetical protein
MSTVVGVGTVVDVVVDTVVGAGDEEEAVACGFAPSLEQLASTRTATSNAALAVIRATLASGS